MIVTRCVPEAIARIYLAALLGLGIIFLSANAMASKPENPLSQSRMVVNKTPHLQLAINEGAQLRGNFDYRNRGFNPANRTYPNRDLMRPRPTYPRVKSLKAIRKVRRRRPSTHRCTYFYKPYSKSRRPVLRGRISSCKGRIGPR